MTESWRAGVLSQFDKAASHYDGDASLQRVMAERLAGHCKRVSIPPGLWVDLGSGTGLLADALERHHPGQDVLRLDGSAAMLACQGQRRSIESVDLNDPLPCWTPPATLLASSFVLHWLDRPAATLQHWFTNLAIDGWMAVSVPVQGSFPQWHQAAARADIPCTALPLPDRAALLAALPAVAVQHCSVLRFTQRADHAIRLLKPMATIGAGTTPAQRLDASSWRRLFRAWPQEPGTGQAGLTWQILVLLLRR